MQEQIAFHFKALLILTVHTTRQLASIKLVSGITSMHMGISSMYQPPDHMLQCMVRRAISCATRPKRKKHCRSCYYRTLCSETSWRTKPIKGMRKVSCWSAEHLAIPCTSGSCVSDPLQMCSRGGATVSHIFANKRRPVHHSIS